MPRSQKHHGLGQHEDGKDQEMQRRQDMLWDLGCIGAHLFELVGAIVRGASAQFKMGRADAHPAVDKCRDVRPSAALFGVFPAALPWVARGKLRRA